MALISIGVPSLKSLSYYDCPALPGFSRSVMPERTCLDEIELRLSHLHRIYIKYQLLLVTVCHFSDNVSVKQSTVLTTFHP